MTVQITLEKKCGNMNQGIHIFLYNYAYLICTDVGITGIDKEIIYIITQTYIYTIKQVVIYIYKRFFITSGNFSYKMIYNSLYISFHTFL